MADTTDTNAAPAAYAPAATFLVALARAAEWPKGSGIMHTPRGNPHQMTGAVLNDIVAEAPNAVANVVPR